jgi:hypothetical protein
MYGKGLNWLVGRPNSWLKEDKLGLANTSIMAYNLQRLTMELPEHAQLYNAKIMLKSTMLLQR